MSDALRDRIGIFARTFRRDSAAEVAAAVAGAGYSLAHWNFAAIGKATLAHDVGSADFVAVRSGFDAAGLLIPSVSATYNMIHPDADFRAAQTAAAVALIGQVPELGADVATLCTGTRDLENMWRSHPDNVTEAAWSDLRRSLDVLLAAAGSAGIRLGVEPEAGNVIVDAPTAARLLDELGADAPIGIVFDPANLLSPETVHRQEQILTEAVDILGDRILCAQAKDVVPSGYSAAGRGAMDYHLVMRLLQSIRPVPLIVQDADEADAARVHADLLRWDSETRASARQQ
jgi:sugar phosphate isomerase/epimerase